MRTSQADGYDALALLKEDHRKVQKLIRAFKKKKENGESLSERKALAKQLCDELTVHAQIEEEIFYPAIRRCIEDKELVNEAFIEHASAKELISQIESNNGDPKLLDAQVKVLSTYIKHHIKEEENEIFPEIENSEINTESLGKKLLQRKEKLMAELDINSPPS